MFNCKMYQSGYGTRPVAARFFIGGRGGGEGGAYLKNPDQITNAGMISHVSFEEHKRGFRGSGGMFSARENFKI